MKKGKTLGLLILAGIAAFLFFGKKSTNKTESDLFKIIDNGGDSESSKQRFKSIIKSMTEQEKNIILLWFTKKNIFYGNPTLKKELELISNKYNIFK